MKKRIRTFIYFYIVGVCLTFTACGIKEQPLEVPLQQNTLDETGLENIAEEDNSEKEASVTNIDVPSKEENESMSEMNSSKASLIDSLENYGDKEPYERLYSMCTPCGDIPDLAGTWNRTNVHSSFCGVIEISDVDANGFNFTAEEYYYSHSGWMECEAKFITDKCAVAKLDDFMEEEYIAFIIQDEGLTVIATGSSADLGFGMNVSIDGEYTKAEPFYTNANILNDTFSEEELSALQNHIPKEYYEDFFLFSTANGVVTDTQSDNGDRIIESFVPTMGGYGYSLIISGEKEFTITFDDGESFDFSL